MAVALKQERLEARCRPEYKDLIEHAAALSGRGVSELVVTAAREAAMDTIRRYEGMVLTDPRDRQSFVAALLSPPEPNAKLRAAAARYAEATKHHNK